jgi:MFS family permease
MYHELDDEDETVIDNETLEESRLRRRRALTNEDSLLASASEAENENDEENDEENDDEENEGALNVDSVPKPYRYWPLRMSQWRLCLMAVYWFGRNTYQAALVVVIVPSMMRQFVSDDWKLRTMSIINFVSMIFAVVASPIFGALSDRWVTSNALGRRHPYLIVGTAAHVLSLGGMALVAAVGVDVLYENYVLLVLFAGLMVLDNVADACAMAPYSALIPDYVPYGQVGAASGWMGLASMLGNLIGGAVMPMLNASVGTDGLLWLLLMLLFGACCLTLASNERQKNAQIFYEARSNQYTRGTRSPLTWAEFGQPFRSSNFVWVFVTRFLVMLSFNIVTTVLNYFVSDVVDRPYNLFGLVIDDPDAATGVFVGLTLVGSLLSALSAGVLSDRYGRKIMVYISGAMQTLSLIALFFVTNYSVLVLIAPIYGIGFGAYTAVDWALASDALPSSGDIAKDMGIWHISITLPSVMASPIVAVIELLEPHSDATGIAHLGYRVIFVLCIVFMFFGTVLTKKISSSPTPPSSPLGQASRQTVNPLLGGGGGDDEQCGEQRDVVDIEQGNSSASDDDDNNDGTILAD